jgi:type I restriction enzyme S subunit
MGGEWRETTLGEVIELKRGYDLPQRERLAGNVPLVSSSGVTDYHSEAMVRGPGVVTGRYGTLGQVFFIEEEFWPLNTTLYVRDFKGNHPRFISYFLQGLDFFAYSDKAAVPGLNRNHLHQAKIRFPSDRDEQRAIAHILGTLDDKIDLNRRMNETLEAMARALFKSWFVDFDPVRAKAERREAFYAPELWSLFPDALDPDDKPSGWPLGTLIDLCELKRGYDLPTAQRLPGPYPIVSSSGISDSHSVPMAQGPGVVTGRYGTIGEVYFVSEPYWPLNTALYVRDFKGNSPRFVYYELLHVEFQKYSDKAAVPGINRNHLHQAPVVLPSREVQQAFETLLAPVWRRQESNTAEIATLAALRDTLLPKLISGELRVKAAEKIVEAVA